MRRLSALLAVTALLLLTHQALARAIAPPPLGQRVALADTVVIGRVTGIEDMDVELPVAPGAPKDKFRIAIVNVTEGLQGAKDLKTVKVAFQPPGNAGPGPGKGRYPTVNLQSGREYLLVLRKHHEGKYLVCEMFVDALDKTDNPNFDKEVGEVKRVIKLLADTKASLQSKDADERLTTAALLIAKYRTQRTGNEKQQAIDAEESKLILQALQSAEDWNKFDNMTRTSPMILFQRLGLTVQDGWTPPPAGAGQDYAQQFAAAARQWLKQNAGKYRIQRFVEQ
jgi:hypothetical protein